MFSKEVGIDLGTANLLTHMEGEGVIIDEPSVVAIDVETRKRLVAGQNAKDILGRAPGRVLAIHPLKDGVIMGFEVTEIILNFFFKKLTIKRMFKRPAILIYCPSNITNVERNAIRDMAYRAGAKKVYIEEEPKVTAVGVGLDTGEPGECMVLDVGGGTTDVAAISLGEIVNSTSLKIAGDTLDRDIIELVKENGKLLIGDRTAEEVKKQIGTTWKGSMHETIEVSGHDLVAGLPITVTLSSGEIRGSMTENLQDVVRACKTVLEQTPPELVSDVVTRGIVLADGGALLHGIDELLYNELHTPVYVAKNALHCAAEGTGTLLEDLHLMQ